VIPELTPEIIGSSMLNRMVSAVAEKDPRAAMEFAITLPEEFRTNPAIASARSWAGSEPIAALEWCRTNGIELTRGERIGDSSWASSVLDECVASHFAETAEWIQSLPEEAERQQLAECGLRRVLQSETRNPQEPLGQKVAAVMQLYSQLAPDSQDLLAGPIAAKLSVQPGFTDLATITERFTSERARLAAIEGAMSGVYEHEASTAESILASLPAGPQQVAALSGIVKALSYRAPAEAAARALQISDSTVQREALDRILPYWLQRDPAAGRAWLAETPIIPREWVKGWEDGVSK